MFLIKKTSATFFMWERLACTYYMVTLIYGQNNFCTFRKKRPSYNGLEKKKKNSFALITLQWSSLHIMFNSWYLKMKLGSALRINCVSKQILSKYSLFNIIFGTQNIYIHMYVGYINVICNTYNNIHTYMIYNISYKHTFIKRLYLIPMLLQYSSLYTVAKFIMFTSAMYNIYMINVYI